MQSDMSFAFRKLEREYERLQYTVAVPDNKFYFLCDVLIKCDLQVVTIKHILGYSHPELCAMLSDVRKDALELRARQRYLRLAFGNECAPPAQPVPVEPFEEFFDANDE